jgi:hypothetical protein
MKIEEENLKSKSKIKNEIWIIIYQKSKIKIKIIN